MALGTDSPSRVAQPEVLKVQLKELSEVLVARCAKNAANNAAPTSARGAWAWRSSRTRRSLRSSPLGPPTCPLKRTAPTGSLQRARHGAPGPVPGQGKKKWQQPKADRVCFLLQQAQNGQSRVLHCRMFSEGMVDHGLMKIVAHSRPFLLMSSSVSARSTKTTFQILCPL